MPRINLLPIRAERRRDSAKQELYGMVAGLVVLIGGLYLWYAAVDARLSEIEGQIAGVRQNIGRLEKDVVKVKDLEKRAKRVERKKKMIERLQAMRIGPAKLLDDLATIFTDENKVWLMELQEANGRLRMIGGAIEHEDISQFQMALQRRSVFFRAVKLEVVETHQGRGKAAHLRWVITCKPNYAAG